MWKKCKNSDAVKSFVYFENIRRFLSSLCKLRRDRNFNFCLYDENIIAKSNTSVSWLMYQLPNDFQALAIAFVYNACDEHCGVLKEDWFYTYRSLTNYIMFKWISIVKIEKMFELLATETVNFPPKVCFNFLKLTQKSYVLTKIYTKLK